MAKTLRFIIIPKVAHPWFEEVHQGALAQAEILGRELRIEIVVDYKPPSACDVDEQNTILENAANSQPSGIAVDPVDAIGHMTAIQRIRDQGVPIVLFDSPSLDSSITSVGNNFAEQGIIAAERLVRLIDYTGEVAVMQGFPTAPNHQQRFEAQLDVLKQYPDIMVVDGGIDNDNIEIAYQQALSVLKSHPELRGYLCCDASGPIGIAKAIKEAGKIGKVKVVSMDGIKPILHAIKDGVIDSSSATMPRMQGSMSILMLWQASLGVQMPRAIDTGIDIITQENVDRRLAILGDSQSSAGMASYSEEGAHSLLAAFMSYTDLRIRSIQRSLEILASTAEARSGSWRTMENLLRGYQESDPGPIVWYARPDGTYYTVDKGRIDKKLSDRSYFPDLMAGMKITGDLVVSKSTGQRSAVIAVPVKQDGKVVGAVGISLFLSRLSDQIGAALDLPPGVSFFALAPNGFTTVHRKTEREFLDPREMGSDTLKKAANEMLSGGAGTTTYEYDDVTKGAVYRTSTLTHWSFAIAFSRAPKK